jgi:hypothetical protein
MMVAAWLVAHASVAIKSAGQRLRKRWSLMPLSVAALIPLPGIA